MAWVFDDPWDDYMNLSHRWDLVSAAGGQPNPSIEAGQGRRGTSALLIPAQNVSGSGWSYIQKNLPYATTYISQLALHIYTGQSPNTDTGIFNFIDGASSQVGLYATADGHLRVKRGSTTLATSSVAIPYGSFRYIEIKVVCDNTTGVVVVRLDGTEVINLTGIDTCQSGVEQIGAVQFGGGYGGAGIRSSGFYVDDFILMNTSGSRLNDFIGDHYLGVLLTDGVGASAQFTVTAASANWQAVRDKPTQHNAGTYNTWTATASATDAGNIAANVISGDPDIRWRATSGLPYTLDFNMGAARTLTQIDILPYTGSENPATIELYVSTDGITWGAAVETVTGLTNSLALVQWVLTTSYSYQYFRLRITAQVSGGSAVSIANVSAVVVYVSSTTVTNLDLYNYEPADPTLGNIAFASVWPYANKTDGGARSLRVSCKSGVTTVDNGSDIALATDLAYYPVAYETDPNTSSPWTIANFNAAQFGPKDAA